MMIQVSGLPFQQSDMWPTGSVERMIVQRMNEDTVIYSYQFIDELLFEVNLRRNIMLSAKAMHQSQVRFESFANSRCNPQYWNLTSTGGFILRHGVKPSDAIQDIYMNSSQYAFECATAMVIIYYHAVLQSMGEALFNQYFQNIYLYSWSADSDLGINPIYLANFLPGDVIYLENPDFNPQTAYWRGENAVDLGDSTYFGHGLGIKTVEQLIQDLNQHRFRGSNRSAYLTNIVGRPDFKHLAKLLMSHPGYSIPKYQHIVHHNESSVPIDRYI